MVSYFQLLSQYTLKDVYNSTVHSTSEIATRVFRTIGSTFFFLPIQAWTCLTGILFLGSIGNSHLRKKNAALMDKERVANNAPGIDVHMRGTANMEESATEVDEEAPRVGSMMSEDDDWSTTTCNGGLEGKRKCFSYSATIPPPPTTPPPRKGERRRFVQFADLKPPPPTTPPPPLEDSSNSSNSSSEGASASDEVQMPFPPELEAKEEEAIEEPSLSLPQEERESEGEFCENDVQNMNEAETLLPHSADEENKQEDEEVKEEVAESVTEILNMSITSESTVEVSTAVQELNAFLKKEEEEKRKQLQLKQEAAAAQLLLQMTPAGLQFSTEGSNHSVTLPSENSYNQTNNNTESYHEEKKEETDDEPEQERGNDTDTTKKALSPPSSSPAHKNETSRTCYTLEELKKPIEGVDWSKREMFLSDEDFHSLFRMTRRDYISLPTWKQKQAKKDAGIF